MIQFDYIIFFKWVGSTTNNGKNCHPGSRNATVVHREPQKATLRPVNSSGRVRRARRYQAPWVFVGIYCWFPRLQICPLYIFGNKATDGTYGSKYWFPGFGFDSGPNLQPWFPRDFIFQPSFFRCKLLVSGEIYPAW